ncbi:hypothetical protein AB0N93_00090 [Streptomyces sp. NPDC091267]
MTHGKLRAFSQWYVAHEENRRYVAHEENRRITPSPRRHAA